MNGSFLERRLGEVRAVCVEQGRIVAMGIERVFDGARVGAIWGTRLRAGGKVALGREEALLSGGMCGLSEGARVSVEVVRERIPEPGRVRPARVRILGPAEREGEIAPGPDLPARWPAAAETPGQSFPPPVAEAWDTGWAEAETGQVPIAGGLLLVVPTPALTAIDIDGTPDPDVAASAVARLIRRWDIGGSIAIDFPTAPGRGWRQAAAAAFDRAMAGLVFERTAINGFGLLQVVRPRLRPSILERAMLARDETTALALLDRAARASGAGPIAIRARPAVARLLLACPALMAEAARRAGRPIDVVRDPAAGEGDVGPA